jgi:threonine aldolase
VIFDIRASGHTASEICSAVAERGIRCGPVDRFSIRMVTHYDVDRAGIDRAVRAMGEVLNSRSM